MIDSISPTLILRTVLLVEPRPSGYIKTRFGIFPDDAHKKFVKALTNGLKLYKGIITDKEQPLFVRITYYLKRKHVDRNRVLPTGVPDLDNLTKPTLDSLKPEKIRRKIVGLGVIPDDSQITDLYVRKRYAKLNPKLIIEIWKHSKTQLEPDQYLTELFPTGIPR